MNSLLITAKQLSEQLHDYQILDVRHSLADFSLGHRKYKEGHIPGAWFLDHEIDLCGPKTATSGRHPLPDREELANLLGSFGLHPEGRFVVYDDGNSMFAAHAWWLLKWLGCEHVQVLDGGFEVWKNSAYPISQDVPEHGTPEQWLPLSDPLVDTVSMQAVKENIHSPQFVLVDARAAARYRGEVEPIDPKAGHIPGALNVPCTDNLQENGCFKTPEVLREQWLTFLGNKKPEQIVNQCGSGITACHNVFAMELAGLHGSRLYSGSWSQWCSDPDNPIVTGDRP
ncbi:sulfurtransferase [Basilea psittacipulmonis]|uniref:Rhodanese domain-containing protein n=1 Tax=Basilea psittacipulmonis DSM 24701 TaxID=1072685 RepID=A0A077DED0_9BURK|nr:sulfurtransferase [Basilea psittacipulmonis]AIL32526.1 hypothetical protein IX83_03690 [Basilea psittacipulmonis DSM 24701]